MSLKNANSLIISNTCSVSHCFSSDFKPFSYVINHLWAHYNCLKNFFCANFIMRFYSWEEKKFDYHSSDAKHYSNYYNRNSFPRY